MSKIDSVKTERVNTGTDAGTVSKAIKRGQNNRRKSPVSEPEKDKLRSEMRTQGRTGVHMQRLNLAVTPENDRAVRTLAAVTGQSMIKTFNKILDEYRESHKELFADAERVLKEFEGE